MPVSIIPKEFNPEKMFRTAALSFPDSGDCKLRTTFVIRIVVFFLLSLIFFFFFFV